MWPVTPRFLANLGTASWARRVEFSDDAGGTWYDVPFVAGTVTQDVGQLNRWSADLSVRDLDVAPTAVGGFGTQFRVSAGLVYDPDDIEWVPLGRYHVQTLDSTRSDPSGWHVTGASQEWWLARCLFLRPQVFAPQSGQQLATRLVRNAIPDAILSWACPDRQLAQIAEKQDRWGVLDGRDNAPSIAKAFGAVVYCDAAGTFVVEPVPSLADDPVWSVQTGPDGLLVEAELSLSNETTRNVAVVTGKGTTGTVVTGGAGGIRTTTLQFEIVSVLGDTDPLSATNVRFGRVPVFYTSPHLTTQDQCDTVAQSLLARNLGLAQQVSLSAVANPALNVGRVILAEVPDGTVQRHLLDSLSLDLGAMTMSGTTRSATTRLKGQPIELPTTGEGG